jgi:hypothetical protein
MLTCSVCLYTGSPDGLPDPDPDALLTVVAGTLVCSDHVGYVTTSEHSLTLGRVAQAAGYPSLGAMQTERARRRREALAEGPPGV